MALTSRVLQRELLHRLDFLDEYIDTLERDKQKASDRQQSEIEKAKHFQQKAREHFDQDDLHNAWLCVHRAEINVGLGQTQLSKVQQLDAKLDEIYGQDPLA